MTMDRNEIVKAFTWHNPFSAHGLMHMVISNSHGEILTKLIHCLCIWQYGLELFNEYIKRS